MMDILAYIEYSIYSVLADQNIIVWMVSIWKQTILELIWLD